MEGGVHLPVLATIGKAVPPYCIEQKECREFTKRLFAPHFGDIERLLKVFLSAEVDKRHFCTPLGWFGQTHDWHEKNELFLENALALSAAAIKECLHKAGFSPQDIDALILVTSTGFATPSIDAYLYNLLTLQSEILRIPIWGLGCAGGVVGVARGFDLARAYPEKRVVVCCVELCSLTFMYNDRSKSNLVATSLFADGAAAALILGDEAAGGVGGAGPRYVSSCSNLLPDTLDVMGWNFQNDGMQVVFSRNIPQLVETDIRSLVISFLTNQNLGLAEVKHFIPHPGGMKVLKAYEKALDLSPVALHPARQVLRDYGNMSSCTVLYVLEKEMEKDHETGDYGLMLALGPGFSCEQVLLQW